MNGNLRYALSGNLPKDRLKDADEIILYIPHDMDLSSFVEKYNIEKVINDYCDKTIIIARITANDLKYKDLTKLLKKDNILLSTVSFAVLEKVNKEYRNKFFTLEPIDSFDKLKYCINILNVKRVVIEGKLGFDLKKIKLYNNEIEIMINPCEANGDIKSFFIRPEDIDFYSNYVDSLFFPLEQEYTLFEIYKKDKKWYGKLNEIIKGLDSEINNKYFSRDENNSIVKSFRDIRSTCGKRCQENECSVCEKLENISKLIEDKENERGK